MIIEISVALIAFTLIVGMISFLVILGRAQKTLESAKKDVHSVSTETIALIQKMDELVADIKSKSDSLDFVFKPFKAIGKGKHRMGRSDTVSEIVDWVGTSLTLFNKIKSLVRHREKG